LNPVVEALQALRGVQLTVAITLVAAIGDLSRFDTPRELMPFGGLSPAAYAAGARRQQGAMTKAGHTPARRALVEGAGAYRYPAKVSRQRQLRLEKPPQLIQASRWKAQVRRCQRYRRLGAQGKQANGVTVASARELAGFLWAMAKEIPVIPYGPKTDSPCLLTCEGCQRTSAEPQPRCGVILGGVKRP
jgi:hypothetical protein